MADLTPVSPDRAANALAMEDAEASDQFVTTGKELVLITNGGASPVTLTVTTTATVDGEAVADKEIEIPAGETHLLGPWPKAYYGDAEDKVTLGYGGAHADVDVAVIQP